MVGEGPGRSSMSVSHPQLSSEETKSFSCPQGNFCPQAVHVLSGPSTQDALSAVFVVDGDDEDDSDFVEEESEEVELSAVAALDAPLVWLSVE